MFKQAIPVAVAAALMLSMAGCSGNDRGGGGWFHLALLGGPSPPFGGVTWAEL